MYVCVWEWDLSERGRDAERDMDKETKLRNIERDIDIKKIVG